MQNRRSGIVVEEVVDDGDALLGNTFDGFFELAPRSGHQIDAGSEFGGHRGISVVDLAQRRGVEGRDDMRRATFAEHNEGRIDCSLRVFGAVVANDNRLKFHDVFLLRSLDLLSIHLARGRGPGPLVPGVGGRSRTLGPCSLSPGGLQLEDRPAVQDLAATGELHMSIEDSTTFEISTHGQIDPDAIERAKDRLERVGAHCREPILHVELRVTDDSAHPSQDHARAEATFGVKHGPVRAHAQAPTVNEAIDLMIERLRRRVDRHESRLHRVGTKRQDGVAAEGSWHHGDVSSAPRRPVPLPDGSATVVRRKTFAAAPMTVEEAAFDLEILDHDFYLFEETKSGQAGLLSIKDDGRYQLEIAANAEIEASPRIAVDRVDGPLLLDQQGAQRLLDSSEDPFVFHRVTPSQPGQVMYRRYDGDYGVVELAISGSAPRDSS